MLQVRQPERTCYVVMGTQCVESAVQLGGQWLEDSLIILPVISNEIGQDTSPLETSIAQLGVRLNEASQLPQVKSIEMKVGSGEMIVLVADAWLATVSMPCSPAFNNVITATSLCREYLASAGFNVTDEDVIRWDDVPYGQPRLVVAYPKFLMESLQRVARNTGMRLAAVLPLGAIAWAKLTPSRQALLKAVALMDDDMITLMYGRLRIAGIHIRAGLSVDDNNQNGLNALWQRLRLREPYLAQGCQLQLMDLRQGEVPSIELGDSIVKSDVFVANSDTVQSKRLALSTWPSAQRLAVNAIHDSPSLKPVQLVTMAATFLVTCLILIVASVAVSTARSKQILRDNTEANTIREARVQIVNPDQVNSVNRAIRELNLPITAIFQALQAPSEMRVSILSIEVGHATNRQTDSINLKILAQAKSWQDMMRYLELIQARNVLFDAQITQHEIVDSSDSGSYRFTLEALWLD